jgi:hypothetical protein
MTNKLAVGLFTLVCMGIAAPAVQAQQVDCRFFRVGAERLNVFTEPRGDATFLGAVNRDDTVCVAGDQMSGDQKWAYIAYRLLGGDRRKSLDGWAIMSALRPASQDEVAALRNAAPEREPPREEMRPSEPPREEMRPPEQPREAMRPSEPPPSMMPPPPPREAMQPSEPPPPPPSAMPGPPASETASAPPPPPASTAPSAALPAPTPAPSVPSAVAPPGPGPVPPAASSQSAQMEQEIIRFNQPINSGSYPVNGYSLAQLVRGVPEFPPIEGLPESVWRKTCDNCHQWNQQSLCVQAKIYAADPKMAFRKQHPYGGPEKTAMMNWAEHGCQ